MMNKIHILPTGISLVDKAWGGFYLGACYCLIGPHKSGKSMLGLHYARECARQKQVCLYFTSRKPKDLLIQAATIDFDIQAFISQNLIIIIKISTPAITDDLNFHDEHLAQQWADIMQVVHNQKPDKIVFDDFSPFLSFFDHDILKEVFKNSMEVIENRMITSLFIFSDPANQFSEKLVDTVVNESNGVIYIESEENSNQGEITITPIIGHPEGKHKANYFINPYEGITDDFVDPSPMIEVAKGQLLNKIGNRKRLGYADDENAQKYSGFLGNDSNQSNPGDSDNLGTEEDNEDGENLI